ncbi:unsaturated glucuronyl hydrolase [Ilyonectria robusta]|uniref:unsaturated glucuronyl hydrolase n=1 Tax=Ilyonectria robusta TaxID=1079257 RepID=UPI001E8D75DA|nr:unsaturated glucuronyl hydrolase [Ilyonectria robusta]KAH8673264.1 unsaturated glucuronyl hydrolase [Ilyonectria robusta]
MVINNSGGLVSDFHHVPPVLNGSHCGGRTSIDDQEMMNGDISTGKPQHGDAPSAVAPTTTHNGISTQHSLRDVLYSTDVYAKIWNVASQALDKSQPPALYPEYTKPNGTRYVYREHDFWTSGFFPGCLYLLLERERKYKSQLQTAVNGLVDKPHQMHLEFACKWWTVNLHQNASLSTTHDLGFMVFPWAQLAWELNHDVLALDTIVRASRTLASRYVPHIGAIRSWDTCITKRYAFTDPKTDFLFIIDNMMNLNMLFWTASELDDKELYRIALSHARKTQEFHIRDDFSTTHLVVLDPITGSLKSRLTNQGFSDDSSWARGQAWAIAGFAQTFQWTKDVSFLKTAQSCADYFLSRLPADGIPPWDFSAPKDTEQPPDTSAAVIAAYGLLLIHEAQVARGQQSDYFDQAIRLLKSVCSKYLNTPDKFVTTRCVIDTVESLSHDIAGKVSVKPDNTPETILGGATINNYEFAPRRWANHGLVYADYYFLLVGNKLLEMHGIESIENVLV